MFLDFMPNTISSTKNRVIEVNCYYSDSLFAIPVVFHGVDSHLVLQQEATVAVMQRSFVPWLPYEYVWHAIVVAIRIVLVPPWHWPVPPFPSP